MGEFKNLPEIKEHQMSAKKLPVTFVQSIAEQDETCLLNARLACESARRGRITHCQLDSLLQWQQMSAVRRHDARIGGGR